MGEINFFDKNNLNSIHKPKATKGEKKGHFFQLHGERILY